MDEAADVTPGGTVPERQFDLAHIEPRAGSVDRHPHLGAEAGGNRKAGGPRRGRERTLARKRLARRHTAEYLDQVMRDALRDPESSAETFGERGDGEVAAAVDQPG